MRLYSGWIGMCCLAIGLLSIIFDSVIAIENKLDRITSTILIIAGIVLMLYGRKYLPAWLGALFNNNDDDS